MLSAFHRYMGSIYYANAHRKPMFLVGLSNHINHPLPIRKLNIPSMKLTYTISHLIANFNRSRFTNTKHVWNRSMANIMPHTIQVDGKTFFKSNTISKRSMLIINSVLIFYLNDQLVKYNTTHTKSRNKLFWKFISIDI